VWKLIQRIKQGKVVVLTTHSLEEADAFSDKIAILAAGSLKCQGSSLALKNTYGTGYSVSIVTVKPEAVKMVLQREFSAATVMDQSADSLLIALPRGDMETMQRLFKELESGELGDMVSDWGVSNTTLEDVFMAVTGQIEALE
jgi:ABC-type multidrug transport system ATPase subunit